MYILLAFKDMSVHDMIKDQHWVEDPKHFILYCDKHGLSVRDFAPKEVFYSGVNGKRLRKRIIIKKKSVDTLTTQKKKKTIKKNFRIPRPGNKKKEKGSFKSGTKLIIVFIHINYILC